MLVFKRFETLYYQIRFIVLSRVYRRFIVPEFALFISKGVTIVKIPNDFEKSPIRPKSKRLKCTRIINKSVSVKFIDLTDGLNPIYNIIILKE